MQKITFKWRAEASEEDVKTCLSLYNTDYMQYFYSHPSRNIGLDDNTLIAYIGIQVLGFVWFKYLDQVYYLSSIGGYGVLPAFRGQKLAHPMLSKAIDIMLKANFKEPPQTLFAYILNNKKGKISQKVLEKCGFTKYFKDFNSVYFKKDLFKSPIKTSKKEVK